MNRGYWRIIWPDGSSTVRYGTLADAVNFIVGPKVYGDTPKPKVKRYRRADGPVSP